MASSSNSSWVIGSAVITRSQRARTMNQWQRVILAFTMAASLAPTSDSCLQQWPQCVLYYDRQIKETMEMAVTRSSRPGKAVTASS